MSEDPGDKESISKLPSSRHRHLIDHIQDAVVEFEFDDEREPIITEVNNSFVEIFAYESAEIIGEPLNELVVPEWQLNESQELDQAVLSGEVTYRRVKRKTASGLREFLYRGIPYRTEEIEGGFAVYTDLTELNWSEQRFKVMNRILRHNLRNKTNVIEGYLSDLFIQLNNTAFEDPELEKKVKGAVSDLERLVEEAHAVRTIINESRDNDVAVDCVPLIQDAVTMYRQSCPSATIETELPERLSVRATSSLHFAIESLIDNAIKHNPSTCPHVRIRAEYADSGEWVDLYVEDNGPMIPAVEKEVITGTTEISATSHGSGLGLWLVKWTTETFGGKLTFQQSEFGGNSVHLRLASN